MEFTRQNVKLSLNSGPGFQVSVEDMDPRYAYDVTSHEAGLDALEERLSNEPHVTLSERVQTNSDTLTCRVTVGTRKGRRIVARWERESPTHHVPVSGLEDKEAYLLALGCDSFESPVLFQVTDERKLVSLAALHLTDEQRAQAFFPVDRT